VLTATFTNRNTAAVYFGSCATIWMLILLERFMWRLPRNTSPTLAMLIRPLCKLDRETIIPGAALFACLIAMFLTGSRAGVILSLLAVLAAVGLFIVKAVPLGRAPRMLLAATCIIAILIPVLGAGVLGRFDSEGLANGGRSETYRSTLAIIGDHPWFGT